MSSIIGPSFYRKRLRWDSSNAWGPLATNALPFYMGTSGSDSLQRDGLTIASAWRTGQYAISRIYDEWDCGGLSLDNGRPGIFPVLNVLPGTYNFAFEVAGPLPGVQARGGGPLLFWGGGSSTAIIQTTSACFSVLQGGTAVILGFTMQCQKVGTGCIESTSGGFVEAGLNVYLPFPDGYHLHASDGAGIVQTAQDIIEGGNTVASHIRVDTNGRYSSIAIGTATNTATWHTLTLTPQWTEGFVSANTCGTISIPPSFWYGGAAGPSYSAATNGVILSGGNVFPGNAVGTVASQGLFMP